MNCSEMKPARAVMLAVVVVTLGVSCARLSRHPEQRQRPVIGLEYERVSLIRLLARVEEYDGKKVLTSGYYRIGFEESALYVCKDLARRHSILDGLWVEWRDDAWVDPALSDGCYVIVAGTVDARRHGHGGLSPGEIIADMVAVE